MPILGMTHTFRPGVKWSGICNGMYLSLQVSTEELYRFVVKFIAAPSLDKETM